MWSYCAAGVWADEVGGVPVPTIRPAKGVHITALRSRLPAETAAVLPVAEDGRSIFVIPWPGTERVYVGTRRCVHRQPARRHPQCHDQQRRQRPDRRPAARRGQHHRRVHGTERDSESRQWLRGDHYRL